MILVTLDTGLLLRRQYRFISARSGPTASVLRGKWWFEREVAVLSDWKKEVGGADRRGVGDENASGLLGSG